MPVREKDEHAAAKAELVTLLRSSFSVDELRQLVSFELSTIRHALPDGGLARESYAFEVVELVERHELWHELLAALRAARPAKASQVEHMTAALAGPTQEDRQPRPSLETVDRSDSPAHTTALPIHPLFFAVGAGTLLVALAMSVLGFVREDLTGDQRRILNVLFSLASGFSVGSFVGSVTLGREQVDPRSRLGVFTLTATSGFGVFLLFFYSAPFAESRRPHPAPHEIITTPVECPRGALPVAGSSCMDAVARGPTSRPDASAACIDRGLKLCGNKEYEGACREHGDIVMQQVQPEFSFDHGSNSWEGCGLTGTSPWPERARYRCCGGRTGDWSTAHDSDHTSTGSNSSPTFVALQGATFTIGGNCPSPDQPTFRAPEATVRLPGFRISKDEVSQAQYAALTPAFEPEGNPLLPVRQVTWFDAVAYCEKLHEKLTGSASGCVRSDGKAGYDPQQCKVDTVYRLPTEAEWEYAAGGAEQAPQDLGTTAVYSTDGPLEPGSRSPNDLGVRHMLGNVSEWTLDVYFSNRTPHAVLDSPMFVSRDPHAVRVVKGGSFHNASEWLRSCGRHGMAPSTRTDFRGFRCVKGPARPEQDLLYK